MTTDTLEPRLLSRHEVLNLRQCVYYVHVELLHSIIAHTGWAGTIFPVNHSSMHTYSVFWDAELLLAWELEFQYLDSEVNCMTCDLSVC